MLHHVSAQGLEVSSATLLFHKPEVRLREKWLLKGTAHVSGRAAPEPRSHCVARKPGEGHLTSPGVREGFLEEGTMFREERSAKPWE